MLPGNHLGFAFWNAPRNGKPDTYLVAGRAVQADYFPRALAPPDHRERRECRNIQSGGRKTMSQKAFLRCALPLLLLNAALFGAPPPLSDTQASEWAAKLRAYCQGMEKMDDRVKAAAMADTGASGKGMKLWEGQLEFEQDLAALDGPTRAKVMTDFIAWINHGSEKPSLKDTGGTKAGAPGVASRLWGL